MRPGPLLLLAAVLLAAGAAQALAPEATVRNAPPRLVTWEGGLDGTHYVYGVEAADGNGIEDLIHITFTVDGGLRPAAIDAEGRADGRRAVVWNCSFALDAPAVVTLAVHDAFGAMVEETRLVVTAPLATIPPPPAPSVVAPLAPFAFLGAALTLRTLRRH